jgi:recombination protein RecR
MDQLPHLQQLLRQLQQVPYLASKNLYRVAHYFLEMEPRRFEQFMGVLTEAHKQLAKCEICFAWKEREQACIWCSASKRNQGIICVVETWHDLCAIEKTGAFSGVYHVLGGAICPLEGRGPEDLTIEPLIERIKNGGSEIILALNQTPEGEATAAYIARRLESISHQAVLSCLSRGLPVGSSLEMMDRLTIFKALAERRNF